MKTEKEIEKEIEALITDLKKYEKKINILEKNNGSIDEIDAYNIEYHATFIAINYLRWVLE